MTFYKIEDGTNDKCTGHWQIRAYSSLTWLSALPRAEPNGQFFRFLGIRIQ